MKVNEISASDDTFWTMGTGNSFYVDFENIKQKFNDIMTTYENSTSTNIINDNIDKLADMKRTIRKMYNFCKKSHPDSETEEMLKSLRTMNSGCESMIEDLKRYL